jgi:hypothetical protein
MPCLSSPVDFDSVSFVQSLVAAFGLVCAVSQGKLQSFPVLRSLTSGPVQSSCTSSRFRNSSGQDALAPLSENNEIAVS